MGFVQLATLFCVTVLASTVAVPYQGYGYGNSVHAQDRVSVAVESGGEGMAMGSGKDDGHHHEVEYHHYPKYDYKYGVKDEHTGDVKEHHESRDGDKVKGMYSLLEADGTRRVVHYTVDGKSGFQAVVTKEGHPTHTVAEPAKHDEKPAAATVAHVRVAPVVEHKQPAFDLYSSQGHPTSPMSEHKQSAYDYAIQGHAASPSHYQPMYYSAPHSQEQELGQGQDYEVQQ